MADIFDFQAIITFLVIGQQVLRNRNFHVNRIFRIVLIMIRPVNPFPYDRSH
jgi:hypothetical protein